MSADQLRVVALSPYPIEAAGARLRLFQMVGPLAARGIDLEVLPMLTSRGFAQLYSRSAAGATAGRLVAGAARRVAHLLRARGADAVVVMREALIYGPPLFEHLLAMGRSQLVLDLDDATFVGYDSPTYGRLGRWLKWPGKADTLIDLASLVTCGNRRVADYVERRGKPARLVPTVVDTDVFRPRSQRAADTPVVGWIGTHSTFQYLEPILPVLGQVRRTHEFRLLLMGADHEVDVPGLEVENRPWSLESEVPAFRSLDIGLYPLADDEWARGKSGLKSIQYMACGVPFIASPVGAVNDLGQPGVTHLLAHSDDDWASALADLLTDRERRLAMGESGRAYVLAHYTLDLAADAFAAALRAAASV